MFFWFCFSFFVLFSITIGFGLLFSGRRADEISEREYAQRTSGRAPSMHTISDRDAFCGAQKQKRQMPNL